jgi:hypothetical protein
MALVNDVASLNVYEIDEDSSSNWVVVLLKVVERMYHRYSHDDRKHDVDNEMY